MSKRPGFNLVEISVVIAILGILMMIGIPSARFFIPNIELTTTAREVTSQLRFAAQQSVTEQVKYLIKFNTVLGQYSLYRLPDPLDPEVEEFIETKELPSSISFNSISGLTENEVSFNSAGAPSESGQIELKNTNNSSKTINIRPSGYVKIE